MGAFQELLLANHAIDVRVDYYDKREADCFNAYANAAEIAKIAGSEVTIPLAEFLTYALFVNKRPQLAGLGSFSEIKSNLAEHAADFNRGLRVTSNSLRTVLTGNDQLPGLSEKIGTGAALAVVNRLTGLSEADWERIPIGRKKADDFGFSAPQVGHVEVEAKGCSIENNTGAKHASVRKHAADIRGKFAELQGRAAKPNVIRYGVIGAIDTNPDGVLRSWLIDPPAGEFDRDPREQQILNRLAFVAETLEVVLPPSALVIELYKRIAVLAQTNEFAAFDGVPLSGTVASWRQAISRDQPQDLDGRFFGTIITLPDRTRFFYGIRREWIDAVQQQHFAQISDLKWEPLSASGPITIPGRFEEKAEGLGPRKAADRSHRDRVEISHLHTASSGRVFGIVGEWAGRSGVHEVADW